MSMSFVQNLVGSRPVPIEGTDLPLWGMEIDPEEARREFEEFASSERGESSMYEQDGFEMVPRQ